MLKFIKFDGFNFNKKTNKKYKMGLFICPKCEEETRTAVHGIRIKNYNSGQITKCSNCRYKSNTKTLTKHGESRRLLYYVRLSMIQRCTNKKDISYYNYGERGIVVCNEWMNSYESFRDWAEENGYKEKLTIERINNNGNYEPDNCKWIPLKEQSSNTRRCIENKYTDDFWSELFECYEYTDLFLKEIESKFNMHHHTLNKKFIESNIHIRINNTKSKEVSQFSKQNIFIKNFESIVLAKKETGAGHIVECCKNKLKTSGGFIWKYA